MGPVSLVMDLHIVHECSGSISDPSRNGHLHYPNDLDGPLNEATDDRTRQYHTDFNNRPFDTISFMTVIGSTSGRLQCQFVSLLFLQAHRETDLFLATSGFSSHNQPSTIVTWCSRHSSS